MIKDKFWLEHTYLIKFCRPNFYKCAKVEDYYLSNYKSLFLFY